MGRERWRRKLVVIAASRGASRRIERERGREVTHLEHAPETLPGLQLDLRAGGKEKALSAKAQQRHEFSRENRCFSGILTVTMCPSAS